MIAPVKTLDKMEDHFTLAFKANKGRQSPESLEGGPKDTLSLTTSSGTEAAGLAGTLQLVGEEAIEIRAIT